MKTRREMINEIDIIYNEIHELQVLLDNALSKISEGEWVTKTVKRFCPSDCWWSGIFAIEDTWNEEEGSWLEEQDGFCSNCGKQDEHYNRHKYCPYCGSYNGGDEND